MACVTAINRVNSQGGGPAVLVLYSQHNKEKYTSHFIWKGCVWEGVGAWTELQDIDPHSIGHNRVSFLFSWAAQLGAWGPASLGAGFHYCILSPIRLIPNCNCSIGGLKAPSAGCWLSLQHLVSNWSGLQTDWISCALIYIIVQCLPSYCGRHNFALIQPVHGQGYNILIDWMHLLFTWVHFLFWQPGQVVGQYATLGNMRSTNHF